MVASPNGIAPAVPAELSPPSSDSEPSGLVLEITRGRTRHRQRPVNGPRFLIGAGVTCDLRLGGDEIPALHSIVTVDDSGVHLEAISPVPALLVNGRVVRETRLDDRDVIHIGEVELLAHLSTGRLQTQAEVPVAATVVVSTADRAPAELSAIDLIDRIEAEERQIADFEERLRTGARALTAIVEGRAAPLAASEQRRLDVPTRATVGAPHFLSKRPQVLAANGRTRTASASSRPAAGARPEFQQELEQLGRQLTALSQEMQSTSHRASERETHYAAATDILMETQQKLVSQLEALVSQVSAMQQQQQPAAAKPRAIA